MKFAEFLQSDQDDNIVHEKYVFMRKASVTNTLGTFIAPLLVYVVTYDAIDSFQLLLWLGIMGFSVLLRAYLLFSKRIEKYSDKVKIRYLNVGIFFTTLSWGLGWYILAPYLSIEDRALYLLMTSTALFVGIYAYSINRSTLLVFFVPLKALEFAATLAPPFLLPWPIVIGELLFFYYLIKMSGHFSSSWLNSLLLRRKNELLNENLRIETENAISANVAKSKFIAMASHDLRQPLQSLNIYLDLIESDKAQQANETSISQIKKSVKSLNAMFKSLLDISKLDSQVSQIRNETFPLSKLVNSLRDIYEPLASSKKLKLEFNFINASIHGDWVLMQTMLGNLISNSIYYTTEGVVSVNLAANEDFLEMVVADTGAGISENDITQIFNEFYRINETRNLHDGLGLGLSIVMRISKLLNSIVSVESTLGSGTVFKIKTKYLLNYLSQSSRDESIDSELPIIHDPSFENLTVVFFEDDRSIARAYIDNFTSRGFKVFHLSEDLGTLQSELKSIDRIDCILSDYRLKTTTGDELIQYLREAFNQEIPAIIVTADTSPSHLELFKGLNIKVLHKPIEVRDILIKIKSLI